MSNLPKIGTPIYGDTTSSIAPIPVASKSLKLAREVAQLRGAVTPEALEAMADAYFDEKLRWNEIAGMRWSPLGPLMTSFEGDLDAYASEAKQLGEAVKA